MVMKVCRNVAESNIILIRKSEVSTANLKVRRNGIHCQDEIILVACFLNRPQYHFVSINTILYPWWRKGSFIPLCGGSTSNIFVRPIGGSLLTHSNCIGERMVPVGITLNSRSSSGVIGGSKSQIFAVDDSTNISGRIASLAIPVPVIPPPMTKIREHFANNRRKIIYSI